MQKNFYRLLKIKKRFDDELIDLLIKFKWWDKSIEEINKLIPILSCSDLAKVKMEIEKNDKGELNE